MQFEPAGLFPEAMAKSKAAFAAFAERYWADASFRTSVGDDAAGALRALGLPIPTGVSVRVAANTEDVWHVVLPPDPNTELGDETIAAVAGGGGSAGTAGTVLTVFSSPTFSTASTLGCAGSRD